MATLIEWISSAAGVREVADRQVRPAGDGEFQVRPLPNENIYLWVRSVDNSKVIPQAEPRATRTAWKSIAASMAFVGALFMLLLPVAWNVHAGYKIHALELEREKLQNEKALLEQDEAVLLSPARLAELAAMQALVDPAPEELTPLSPAANSAWAKRQ